MKNSKFLGWSLLVILIAHVFIAYFGLYTSISWIDIVMHFIGGVWVSLLFFSLLGHTVNESLYTDTIECLKIIILAVSFTVFVGVLWEFFEFTMTMITSMPFQGDIVDTMGDLLMDIVGGIVGGIVSVYLTRKSLK